MFLIQKTLERVLVTKYYFVKKITFHLYCALLKNYGLLLHNIKVKSLAWKISAFRGGERSCLRLSYSLFKGLAGYFIGYLRNLQAGNLFSSASSDDALQNRIFLILILFALRSFRLRTVSVPELWACLYCFYWQIIYITKILMSRWITCRVIHGLHPFLPLKKNHNILTYQQIFHSYFHWNTSTTQKKKKNLDELVLSVL